MGDGQAPVGPWLATRSSDRRRGKSTPGWIIGQGWAATTVSIFTMELTPEDGGHYVESQIRYL